METRDTNFVTESIMESSATTSTLPDEITTSVESIITEQDSSITSAEIKQETNSTIIDESELNQITGEKFEKEVSSNTEQDITSDNVSDFQNNVTDQKQISAEIQDILSIETNNEDLINTTQNCNITNEKINTDEENGSEIHNTSESIIETLLTEHTSSENPTPVDECVINKNIVDDCEQELELMEETNVMVAFTSTENQKIIEIDKKTIRNSEENHRDVAETISLEKVPSTSLEYLEFESDIEDNREGISSNSHSGEVKVSAGSEIDSMLTLLEQELGTPEIEIVSKPEEINITCEKRGKTSQKDINVIEKDTSALEIENKSIASQKEEIQIDNTITNCQEKDISTSDTQSVSTKQKESETCKKTVEVLQKDNITNSVEKDTSTSMQSISEQVEIDTTLKEPEQDPQIDKNVTNGEEKDTSISMQSISEQVKTNRTLEEPERDPQKDKNVPNGEEKEASTSEIESISEQVETDRTLEEPEQDPQKDKNFPNGEEKDTSTSEIQIISTEKKENLINYEEPDTNCKEKDTSASKIESVSKQKETDFTLKKPEQALQIDFHTSNGEEKDTSEIETKQQEETDVNYEKPEQTLQNDISTSNGMKNEQENCASSLKDLCKTIDKSFEMKDDETKVDGPNIVMESSIVVSDLKRKDDVLNEKSDPSDQCIIKSKTKSSVNDTMDLEKESETKVVQESKVEALIVNEDRELTSGMLSQKSEASGELDSSAEESSLQPEKETETSSTQSLKGETSQDSDCEGRDLADLREGEEGKPEDTAGTSQQEATVEEVEARLERRLAEFLGVTRPCQVQLDNAEVLVYQTSPPRRGGRSKKLDGRWRLGRPPKIPDELREEWEGPEKRPKMEGDVKLIRKEKKKTDLNTPNRTSLRSTRRCEENFLECPLPIDISPLLGSSSSTKKPGKQKRELANLTIDCKNIITKVLEKPTPAQIIKIPTKKIGRPKKVQSSDAKMSSVMKNENIVSPKIKKKCGRPRKVQDVTENCNVEIMACKVVLNRSESNSEPKKKMGRPRKIQTEISTGNEKIKKKMGRPKKINVEFSPLENKSKFSTIITPKKKMGRPRKIDIDNSKITEPKVKKVKSPKFSPDLKFKKKMGRPRKIPLVDKIVVKTEPVELKPSDDLPRKKMGRPRKNTLESEPKNKIAKKDIKPSLAERREQKIKSEVMENSTEVKKKGRPKKLIPVEQQNVKECVEEIVEESTEVSPSPGSSREVSPMEVVESPSKKKKSPKLTKPCKVILSSSEVSKYLTTPQKPQKRKWSRSSSSDLESSWMPPTPFYDPSTQENMVMCSFCSKKFPERNKYNLRRHMACIHDTEPFCKLCKYILHNETVEEHQCKANKTVFKQFSDTVNNDIPPSIEVSNSDVIVKSEPCFDESSSSSSNKNTLSLSCPYCNKKCSSNFSIKRHMKTFHSNQSFCRYCWILFPDFITLNYHLDTCEQKPRKERKSMKLKMHWENKKHGVNIPFVGSNNIINIVEESVSVSDVIVNHSPRHELFSVPDSIQESQYDNSEFYSSNHHNNEDDSLKTIEISQWKMLASTETFNNKKVENLQNGLKTLESHEWNVSSVVSSPVVTVPVDMLEFHPSPVLAQNNPIFADLDHDAESHRGNDKVYHML